MAVLCESGFQLPATFFYHHVFFILYNQSVTAKEKRYSRRKAQLGSYAQCLLLSPSCACVCILMHLSLHTCVSVCAGVCVCLCAGVCVCVCWFMKLKSREDEC